MHLHLVRHGEAAHPADDPARGLTQNGRAGVEQTAERAVAAGEPVSLILHSDLLRAEQTAAILGGRLGVPHSHQPGLRPESDVAACAEWLAHEERDVMLVGHLPFMGLLASALLRGNMRAATVSFTPGTAAHLIRDDAGRWSLGWTHSPTV
jgi:phosphohistidine phosphatase